VNTDSLLNYLKYQQEIGGDELVLPSDFDGLSHWIKSKPENLSKDPIVKLVPVIPNKKKPSHHELQINTPSIRPQSLSKLPKFKSIDEVYKYLGRENLYQVQKGEKTITCPIVKSTGPKKSKLCVVTMVPTESDLQRGEILRGKDGDLLNKMLNSININRENVYCTSIIKNPDLNANLYHTQKNIHLELVYNELALTGSMFILLLGEKCAQIFLKTGKSLKDLREQKLGLSKNNILNYTEIWVIEHPQKLLRSPGLKHQAWQDLKWIQTLL